MATRKKRPTKKPVGKRREQDALRAYRGKRDFKITSEPSGKVARKHGARYFIQKHAASRLHYDFRLEIAGVLKSWAVPKEIPLHARDKALAVKVEDHPLDYGDFEGTIPKGQYGGGTVMLWDRGTYQVEGTSPAQALKQGKLHLHLKGKKLQGEWALVRMRDDEKQWLLIKAGDSFSPPKRNWNNSVVSRQKMEDIPKSAKVWSSLPEPSFVAPMRAKSVEKLPHGDEWLYELKLDGYRFQAVKHGNDVKLLSGNNNEFTARFPKIAAAIGKLKCGTALLDGEIVVPDEHGVPSFQLIQNADADTPAHAFLFDLLELEAKDLRSQSLTQRRETLSELLPKKSNVLHFSGEVVGDPDALLAEVAAKGLEGIIAKRRSSTYESGRRSGAWVKVKCLNEQEFVIGGFTPPQGTRKFFGALLLGYYRKRDLLFAGKVGTGFDARRLRALHQAMSALRLEKCPFADLPRTRASRWGQAITRAEMARCAWVKPELVCQVRFSGWTNDGSLRHPVFLGMREDKVARDVVRET